MTVYLQHANGTVHSITDEHYDLYESVVVNGHRYPKPGVTIITEDAAKKAHPALFGAPDPRVVEAQSPEDIKHTADRAAAVAAANEAVANWGNK